jgi:hypothetical protein
VLEARLRARRLRAAVRTRPIDGGSGVPLLLPEHLG